MQCDPLDVEVRLATAADARAIGAVFDAAVRASWTYLGEVAKQPMFALEDWDGLVADHAPPNVLPVATDHAGRVLGYTAAHPKTARCTYSSSIPITAVEGLAHALERRPRRAARGRLQTSLSVHPRAEPAGACGLRERGLPPRRIDSRIGLQRSRDTRGAAGQTALTPADPSQRGAPLLHLLVAVRDRRLGCVTSFVLEREHGARSMMSERDALGGLGGTFGERRKFDGQFGRIEDGEVGIQQQHPSGDRGERVSAAAHDA